MRLFVPLYAAGEYCVLKPRAVSMGPAPAPIHLELSHNLLPQSPDNINAWRVSCDGSVSVAQEGKGGRGAPPGSLSFSGGTSYHVRSKEKITLTEGASYIIEASIKAPPGDDYHYSIFFKRASNGRRIHLRVYDGAGHNWKAYHTLFTASKTAAATLNIDMRCPTPHNVMGLKGVSLRAITLTSPDTLSPTTDHKPNQGVVDKVEKRDE
ncbi:MAG: hypothetical protein P8123_03040 [bacterium]